MLKINVHILIVQNIPKNLKPLLYFQIKTCLHIFQAYVISNTINENVASLAVRNNLRISTIFTHKPFVSLKIDLNGRLVCAQRLISAIWNLKYGTIIHTTRVWRGWGWGWELYSESERKRALWHPNGIQEESCLSLGCRLQSPADNM